MLKLRQDAAGTACGWKPQLRWEQKTTEVSLGRLFE